MKTEDLIVALSADATPARDPGSRLARALPPALAVSLAALVLLWHLRPDLLAVPGSVAVLKTLTPLALALATLLLVGGLTRPEARPRAEAAPLVLLLAALAAALVWGLATTSPAQIATLLDTTDFGNCLISVPVLAALPLAATLWAMRAGAPRNPALAGATAGMIAAGGAAAVYSLHCPHDALMYFMGAYVTAMALVVAAGALLGARLLRW